MKESWREDRDAEKLESSRSPEKIKYQAVTSFYESYLLADSFSLFLT